MLRTLKVYVKIYQTKKSKNNMRILKSQKAEKNTQI